MRSIARFLGFILFVSSTSLYALSYPITTPAGETTGGTYRLYFDNIFSSELLCDGANMVVGGFNNIGQPICVTPVSTGLYVTGQTIGDTLRFDGSSWVRNNLLYNDGTAIGIADQTPSYLLDVGGTANFLGIRFPTGASSGYVLTSDAAGLASWSNAPNISLSGVTGGSQYVVPKFGLGGTGLILSSIYDDGVTVGINTLVPSASYKLDVVGGDARLNGIRFGVGGGNIASNVAIGLNAFGANVTSPNNVIIGNLAGTTLTAGAGGNILIGNSVNTSLGTSSNELNIGNWIYGNNGNIGLGTGAGITTRLLVDGQIQITGGSPAAGRYLQSDANGIGIWTGVTASSVTATGIVGGTEYYLTKFGAGGNGIYASVLYESGGLIGLNTMNPSVEFDVNGTIRVRSGGTLGYVLTSDSNGIASWQAPGVSINTWNIIGNASTTAGTHFLGTTDAQDLVFKTNNVEYMRILTTGNVGIGTASPGQRLTLSGGNFQYINGSQGNGRYLMSDANGVATWTGYVVATSLNLAGAVSGSTLYFRSGAWNVGTGIYNAGGNIGIGTVTPGSALEVAGQVKITGGTPGVGKFLVSDATGLASWQSSTATLSGTYWSLSGNTIGANDFIGSLNAQDFVIKSNNVQIGRFYAGGGVSLGTGNTVSTTLNINVLGNNNTITGANVSVVGYGNRISNGAFDGIVAGNNNTMTAGGWPIIIGRNNSSLSTNDDPTIFGSYNQATYHDAILIGMSNSGGGESGQPSLAVGAYNQAGDNFVGYREEAVVVGMRNRVLHQYSSAFGRQNTVSATRSSAFGANITNAIADSTQIGPNNTAKITIFSGGQVAIGTSVITTGATLKVAGQVEITGGIPGAGKVLTSDATGLAFWTGAITATSLNLAGAVTGSTIYYNSGAWRIGTGMFNNGTRVGIGTVNPGAALEVAGQVKITGGTPGLNKVLTSDASGLATWTTALSSLSGSFWSLSGNSAGANDYIGTSNAQNLRFYTNGTQKMVLDTSGNLGIGIASAGTNKLYVNGDTFISGALSILGKLYVDTVVSRTVTNVTISGSLLPDAAAPILYRDIGSNTQRWNNAYLTGQITIGGGSPGSGKLLISDANGLASWTGVIVATNLNLAGAVTGSTIYYNTGAWRVGTGMYNNGTSVGIGTASPTARLTIDSGVNNLAGVRLTRISPTTPVFTGTAAPLGVDGSGNVVVAQQGAIPVYTALGASPNALPNETVNPPTIGANYDRYFDINARQSFAVTDVGGVPYNCPEFLTGSRNKGATGCTQTPWATYVMTAQNQTTGNRYAYQILISDRTDAPFVVRGGMYSSTTGTLMNTAMTSNALWFKAITVPTNRTDWFYINPGVNQNNDPIAGGGNIGIGTMSPTANLDVVGTLRLRNGSPAAGRMLMSDATGVAFWTGAITATSLNLAGGVTGSTIYYNSGAWRIGTGMFNNGTRVGIGTVNPGASLEVAGQVKITGGVPGAGKVLTSDAVGLAYWTGAVTATSLSIPGSVTGSTLYYSGGAWRAGTGIYNAGGNIGIGANGVADSRLIINSGLSGTSGLRFSQVNSTSNVVSTNVIGLGVDAAGNVVPISNGDVIVYDGITSYTPSPNPDNPNREISYDFNQYFRIPAKQSFVVTDGLAPGQNAPYIAANASSSVCEWTGTVGTGITSCPGGDFPGSPYNSFTMSARSDADYGYQIGLAYRGDIQLMARSGKFRDGSDAGTDVDFDDYGSGLYINGTTTPAPWYKVLTLPTNNVQWFYIDTGYTGQWNPTGRAGNVGVGTNTPTSRFEIWNHNSGSVLMHYRGLNNIGIGSGSVRPQQTGSANSGFGHESLYTLTTGFSNTAMGYKSMRYTTIGQNNSAVGQESLHWNNQGSWNSALGYQSIYNNTSGTGNVGLGAQAIYNNTLGANNIGIGYSALRGISGSSTSNNIAIGLNTLSGATGNNNVSIGAEAGTNQQGGNNNITLGYNAEVGSPTGSDQLSIGNWIYGSGGTIGIGTSSLGTAAKLKVAGQIEITGGSPGAGKVLTSDASGLATWQTPSGSGGGGGGTSGWGLLGNSGTVAGTNYVGTADAVDFVIGTNGTEKMRIESGGDVGIGTNNPGSKLDVNGTFKLGANGTQLNGILRSTTTRDIVNINAGTCRNEDFTVTNAITTGTAFVSPSSNLEDRLIIAAARVRAASTVEVEFCNVSGAAINTVSRDYYVTVIQ